MEKLSSPRMALVGADKGSASVFIRPPLLAIIRVNSRFN